MISGKYNFYRGSIIILKFYGCELKNEAQAIFIKFIFTLRLWADRASVFTGRCQEKYHFDEQIGRTMRHLAFTKMQALGNDFVVIDALEQAINIATINIAAIADRKFGIGCDQVLLILPANGEADFFVRIFNADGGEAYQCGNGMRAITKYLVERNKANKKKLILKTAKVSMQAEYRSSEDIAISLPIPLVNTQHPFIEALKPWLFPKIEHLAFVDLGNWHIIFWCKQKDNLSLIDCVHLIKEKTKFFDEVNISLVEYKNENHLELNVWERGSGFTLACGSAAVASVAMGQALGKLADKVIVHQKGGELTIQKDASSNLWQAGSANFIFDGSISL